jgi:hypothetical protein
MQVDMATADPTFNWSYHSQWTLQPVSFLPVNNGMPIRIDDLFSGGKLTFPPPPIDPHFFLSADAVIAFDLTYQSLAPNIPNSSQGDYTGAVVPFDYPSLGIHDTCSIALSKELAFKDHLAVATNRIRGRQFGSFPTPINVAIESYGEYNGYSSRTDNPPLMDGQWHPSAGLNFGGQPYTGGNPDLWSGWLWPTAEEGGQFVDGPMGSVSTKRARFKVNTSVPYFIAQADVNRLPGFGNALLNAGGPDALDAISVLTRGTTIANRVYEIPWPPNDPGDFEASFLQSVRQVTWSCGKICFAIVGSTPEAWRARTGFIFTG